MKRKYDCDCLGKIYVEEWISKDWVEHVGFKGYGYCNTCGKKYNVRIVRE